MSDNVFKTIGVQSAGGDFLQVVTTSFSIAHQGLLLSQLNFFDLGSWATHALIEGILIRTTIRFPRSQYGPTYHISGGAELKPPN